MRRTWFGVLVAAVLIAPAVAFAQGQGGGGGPGGGGPPNPPPEEEDGGNSLSVPTIFATSAGIAKFGVNCGTTAGTPGLLIPPTGVPSTGFEIDTSAYYYVQGVNPWQAQCVLAATGTVYNVTAKWGDNLSGDAPLKVGTPVRVEVGIIDASGVAMEGYLVDKLEPSLLDRNSRYGTLAVLDSVTGLFSAGAQATFPTDTGTGARVFDDLATFSICPAGTTTGCLVPPGTPMGSEINAGGAIVYGYQERFSKAGSYDITFVAPQVGLTDTITIEVEASAGGGGKKPR
jgi:hypothetical protein